MHHMKRRPLTSLNSRISDWLGLDQAVEQDREHGENGDREHGENGDREHGENGDGPRVLWVSFDMEPIPLSFFQPIHLDLPFGKLAFTPLASRGSSTDFGP